MLTSTTKQYSFRLNKYYAYKVGKFPQHVPKRATVRVRSERLLYAAQCAL